MKKSLLSLSALLCAGVLCAAPLYAIATVTREGVNLALFTALMLVAFAGLVALLGFPGILNARRARTFSRVVLSRQRTRVPARTRDPRPPVFTRAVRLAALGFAAVSAAHAQATGDSNLLPDALAPFTPFILTGLAGAAAFLTARISAYLKAKTEVVKNEQLREGLDAVFSAVFTKVAELNQVAIEKLKAAAADGKLSRTEAAQALATAVQEVWASLPAFLKALLVKTYGSEANAKAQVIVPRIEQAVRNQQSYGTSVSGGLSIPALPPKKVTPADIVAARKRIGLQ